MAGYHTVDFNVHPNLVTPSFRSILMLPVTKYHVLRHPITFKPGKYNCCAPMAIKHHLGHYFMSI